MPTMWRFNGLRDSRIRGCFGGVLFEVLWGFGGVRLSQLPRLRTQFPPSRALAAGLLAEPVAGLSEIDTRGGVIP